MIIVSAIQICHYLQAYRFQRREGDLDQVCR